MGPNALPLLPLSARAERKINAWRIVRDMWHGIIVEKRFLISNRPSLCKGQPLFKRWLITLTLLKYAIILTLYYIFFFYRKLTTKCTRNFKGDRSNGLSSSNLVALFLVWKNNLNLFIYLFIYSMWNHPVSTRATTSITRDKHHIWMDRNGSAVNIV